MILAEVAFQNVALVFRNHPRYELLKPVGPVGWRAKKNYFQVELDQDYAVHKLKRRLKCILQILPSFKNNL